MKRINFYTSTCFEGCDLYDENGKVYIVSDRKKSHTLLDISTLGIQICGRIRDSKYKTKIGHIFTETRYNKFLSYKEFKESTQKQLSETKDWLNAVNQMDDKNRKKTINLIEHNNKSGLNEMYIHNENDRLEIDENLINLDIVNFKITKCLYQHRVLLQHEYLRNNFNLTDEKQVIYTDKLAENPKSKISFKDLFDEYAILREERGNQFIFGNENDRTSLIEQERPLVKEAYNKLGVKKVKEMNYYVGNIKRALINIQTDISIDAKIVKCLKENGFSDGITIPVKNIKNILKNIYTSLGLRNSYGKIKTAKATDLENWFKIKRTSPKIKEKTTDCITIIRCKFMYV